VDYSRSVVIRLDTELRITDITGNVANLLNITPEKLISHTIISNELVAAILPVRNRFRLLKRLERYLKAKIPLQETFQIRLHQPAKSKESLGNEKVGARGSCYVVNWFSLMALPVFTQGKFDGYEIYLSEVTASKRIEEASQKHELRLAALYELSKSLELDIDPRVVMARGLKLIVENTKSTGGLVAFQGRSGEYLEIVAASGLGLEEIEKLEGALQREEFIREPLNSGVGYIADERSEFAVGRTGGHELKVNRDLFGKRDLTSLLVLPLRNEDAFKGLLILFKESAKKETLFEDLTTYDSNDFHFVSISASNISYAAQRAQDYSAKRILADSYQALYKLSSELSRHNSPSDIARQAFSIIQGELNVKRMWLGMLSENGTSITGAAGIGPGMRKALQLLRVDFDPNDHRAGTYFAKHLKLGQPLIADERWLRECSVLARVTQQLEVKSLIVMPLNSLNTSLGVLIVEPLNVEVFIAERKLPLLSSMATEIAGVLLARRFEAQMQLSEKMRMAGILASGVAHNFNNLFQAMIGQVSLLELQLNKGGEASFDLNASIKGIMEATYKGSDLVNHLLTFSSPDNGHTESFDIVQALRVSQAFYASLLGSGIQLEVDLPKRSAVIRANSSLIQQVLTSVLVNARDALTESSEGSVLMKVEVVSRDDTAANTYLGALPSELDFGDYLRISVIDNGRGMSQRDLERCYEPFYTTKHADTTVGISASGGGLSLTSAFATLKAQGGTISFESTVNQGTAVHIYLPLSEDKRVINKIERKAEGVLERGFAAGDEKPLELFVIGIESSTRAMLEELSRANSSPAKSIRIIEKNPLQVITGNEITMLVDVEGIDFDINQILSMTNIKTLYLLCSDLKLWRGVRSLSGMRIELLEKPLQYATIKELLNSGKVESAKAKVS
jgi:signal transduction histidine kinase/PAS domain-containing protein